ncbi:MAG: NAD(P)-dependent glycerol-3-phosphate dehydrogenase [Erysipelotrichaceae bacterium]|nr:NAD(P)-dependent glycerol-3-phosphate dehydrogenase [Erysipelotrichaceae bacterium]
MYQIGVLGAGTWGMALAQHLAISKRKVTVWSAISREIDELQETRKHKNLPGMEISPEITFTKNIEEAIKGMDIVLFAVPSVFVRSTTQKAASYIEDGQVLVDVAKGIEPGTNYTMTQIMRDELKNNGVNKNVDLVALSGPTHAEEVALNMPTTIVCACEKEDVAKYVQEVFNEGSLRVYTNPDVLGVELCGAVKNVIALAAGISRGLGYGDNAKAAIITRGMAEISRLGNAMGCDEKTFNGLAGIGDLIVTATSEHSRNNRCGLYIGQGIPVKEAIEKVGMVVEGINALQATMELARKYHVEMPISAMVNDVVYKGVNPKDVLGLLMARETKAEIQHAYENSIINNKDING